MNQRRTVEGALVLQHLVPLEGLIWRQLDRALEMVAHEAARLRAGTDIGRPPSSHPAFPFAD